MDLKNNILLFIAILTTGMVCNSCTNMDNDKILKKIASSVDDGDYIVLSDFTDFQWNNIVLCNPGTSLKEYEKILGPVKFKDFDLEKVIIFRMDEVVVKTIKQNYHPEKYLLVDFNIFTNKYTILNDGTVFRVKKVANHVELSPVGVQR